MNDLANLSNQTTATHAIVWLEHQNTTGRQRLGLVPSMGGSAAAWRLHRDGYTPFELFQTWDGLDHADDPLRIVRGSYPLAPWSNRISGGGFFIGETFYPIAPNAADMPYPIHGDAWQQAWQVTQQEINSLEMTLESNRFNGNPHHYRAVQTFKLVDGGMDQSLTVTHLGDAPLPYGLGQHPWLPRSALTTVQAQVAGVWLSHPDCLPKEHTTALPPSWNMNMGIPALASHVDNCFTGWDGTVRISWPDQQLQLELSKTSSAAEASTHSVESNYLLMYRPAAGAYFCLEPVSHPIDAFHLPDQPGLQLLQKGESVSLALSWRFTSLP